MDYVEWNRGLLLGELLIVVAAMAFVSGRSIRDRVLAVGILAQGIAMIFASGGAYYPRGEFAIAAIALIVLSCLWSVWVIPEKIAAGPDPDLTSARAAGGRQIDDSKDAS